MNSKFQSTLFLLPWEKCEANINSWEVPVCLCDRLWPGICPLVLSLTRDPADHLSVLMNSFCPHQAKLIQRTQIWLNGERYVSHCNAGGPSTEVLTLTQYNKCPGDFRPQTVMVSRGMFYGENTSQSFYCWISLINRNNQVRSFLTFLTVHLESIVTILASHSIIIGAMVVPMTRLVSIWSCICQN